MTNKNVIRVAVGSPDALESSVWRFWTHRDELYVAARETVGFMKLSFHSSGIWRLARVSEQEIGDPLTKDSDPRLMARWRDPGEFVTGWTKCLEVLIPAVPIKNRFALSDAGEPPKGGVYWLGGITVKQKMHLTLLRADSQSRNPAEIMRGGDEIIGKLPLISGKIAWILARRNEMEFDERQYFEEFTDNEVRINFDSDPATKVFAAVMMANHDKPQPFIANFALGWDKIYVDGKPHKYLVSCCP